MASDKDTDIKEKILKTYTAFYDQNTGFHALRHKIRETIRTELSKLYRDNTEKICKKYNYEAQDAERKQLEFIYFGVFRVIYDLEHSGAINPHSPTLTNAEQGILENAITEKIKCILNEIAFFLDNPKNAKNNKIHDLNAAINKRAKLADDNIRFAFTPKQIQKYHFGYGCNHTAIGFIETNQSLPKKYRIPKEDIKLIQTTKWDHMHDGGEGHMIPCIKMQDGLYHAFEPQIIPKNGEIPFITPAYSETPKGETIFHLLQHGAGEPYIITTGFISPDDYMKYYGNHKIFQEKYSQVKRDEAFAFLDKQVSLGNLDQTETKRFKQEYNKYHTKKLKNATKKLNPAKAPQNEHSK